MADFWTTGFPKKLVAAVAASIMAFIGFQSGMDSTTIGIIISPLLTFIVGQGIADVGKEAQKIKNMHLNN